MTRAPTREAGREKWEKPEARWLTLQQALFFFYPAYAAPGASFLEQIRRRLKMKERRPVTITALSDESVAIDSEGVRLTILGDQGQLNLEPADPDTWFLAAGASNPSGHPDKFFAEIERLPRVAPEFKLGIFTLSHLADYLVFNQRRDFREALQSGHATIVGRWHEAREPFTIIQPDQWRYFTLDPDGHDPKRPPIARAGDEVIFSPMVMPIIRKVSSKERLDAEILAWLVNRMRDTADHPMKKETLQKEAIERWGNLPDRTFFRLWENAKTESGVETYGRPGRPKKMVAPTLVKS